MKNYALSLIKPHLEERATQPGIHKLLLQNIREVLCTNDVNQPDVEVGLNKMNKRKRYFFCPTEQNVLVVTFWYKFENFDFEICNF